MSIEETKQPEVAKEPEVTKETEVTSSEAERTISVEVYGIQVDLPMSKAKELISKRDDRYKSYRELQEKVSKAEAEAKTEKSRAELLEAIKKQSVEEVEAMASSKYVEKLNRIQTQVVNKELESALLSNEDFIKESKDDALKLLKAEFAFQVNEEGDKVVSKEGKDAGEVVKEWLSKKDIFRKAKGATPTGGKLQIGKSQHKVQTNPYEGMNKGLGKLLGGN